MKTKNIKSALISVYHKEGLESIIKQLDALDVDIYSTGGTQTYIESLGVKVIHSIDEAIAENDVLNVLRIQLERKAGISIPSLREYHNYFGITEERLENNKDVLILHPGPINRGVELSSEVADGPYQVILDQVTNGVAVRMAVLYLLGTKN